MALCFLLISATGQKITFSNYDIEDNPGYLQVDIEGHGCSKTQDKFVLQHDFDSSRVKGAAASPLNNNSYGKITGARDAAINSGMFIPEFNTGNISSNLEDMWNGWTNNGNSANIYSFKYNPSGKINLREFGSADANVAAAKALKNLPGLNKQNFFNYSTFDEHYTEPWKRYVGDHPHEAYPGLMPYFHPVFDNVANKDKAKIKYVVKRCPEQSQSTAFCCLAIETAQTLDPDFQVNPAGFGLDSKIKQFQDGKEYNIRWNKLGMHTSYSRGVPDIHFYTAQQLKADFEKRPDGNNQAILDELQQALGYIQGGSYPSYSGSGNEFKCRKPSEDSNTNNQQPNSWSFWAASRLEHFYSAVVGAEEAGMLRQKIADWDGAHKDLDNFGPSADSVDDTSSGPGEGKPYGANCTLQPGGHCGFGYYCFQNSNDWDKCSKYRWRGRPEAVRYNGDTFGDIDSVNYPFNRDYLTYPHALDGEEGNWFDAKYRMSARLIWTGGDGYDQRTELPCAITNYIDGEQDVAGDFSRACSKLRATKFEWLVAAMLQAHQYGRLSLNRNGINDQGFKWENERGVGPTPCSHNSKTCYLNNINNRVKMWDLDQSWDFNTNKVNYEGARTDYGGDDDDSYYKRLKNLRQVPGIGNHDDEPSLQPPMWRNFDQNDIKFGASDGTSRTDAHSMACYVSPYPTYPSTDYGAFFNLDSDSQTYYFPKPTLWPFQWGLSRSIGSDVDWNFPSGCDQYYGPPCSFRDVNNNAHFAESMAGKSVRMLTKEQGSDGVITCGRRSDEGNRANWDNSYTSKRSPQPPSSHTCANLGNVTHFKLGDLNGRFVESESKYEKFEEYEFRATTYHEYNWRNCETIACQDAAISIGCHFPMNDPSNGVATLYKNSITVNGKLKNWVFFQGGDNRWTMDGATTPTDFQDDYSMPNQNGDSVLGNVAWVNWGKKQIKTASGWSTFTDGEKLGQMHTVYENGKDDGILECPHPAEDLLLYSLAKSADTCLASATNFVNISACRNPRNYIQWVLDYGMEKGLSLGNDLQEKSFEKYDGRHIYKVEDTDKPSCLCSPDSNCNCGFIARTSRLIVGEDRQDSFVTEKPYKPEWVNDPGDKWCLGDMSDEAHKPRRVCTLDKLQKTNFWSNEEILGSNIPDVFEKQDELLKFVHRENAVFNKAELEQMNLCANSDDGQVCNAIPDVIKGTALVSVLETNPQTTKKEVPLLLPRESDEECENFPDTENQFKGLSFEKVTLNANNIIQLAVGPVDKFYCKLIPDPNDNGDTENSLEQWKVNLDAQATIDPEKVAATIDEFELLKITQCLEASSDCPKIDVEKSMNIVIPSSVCSSEPYISFVCDEVDDNDNVLSTSGTLKQLQSIDNARTLSTFGDQLFSHVVNLECLNRINFFLLCDEITELNSLLMSICGNNNDCNLPQTFKMCSVNPFDTSNQTFRKFRISLPDSVFTDSNATGFDDACYCEDSIEIVFMNEDGSKCYRNELESVYPSNLKDYTPFLCTNFYRKVELRDYRKDLGLQVAWGNCDSVRIKFEDENQFPLATIEPARGFFPKGGTFRADSPIPLSRQTSERFNEGAITWKDGLFRELVPEACRSQFKTAASAMFSRRVAFDQNPGEPMSKHRYGLCPTNETFCDGKADVYIRKAQMREGFFQTPVSVHYGDAPLCPVFCRTTEGCTVSTYDAKQKLCTLYANFSGVVKLAEDDIGLYFEETFDSVAQNTDGIFLCMNMGNETVVVPPPPPPPLRLCPSGQSLVKFIGQPSRCIRSACNPISEMGVHIFPQNDCVDPDDGIQCCSVGRDRQLRTVRPSLWTLENPPNQGVIYDYADTLELEYNPSFEYIFRDVASTTLSEIKKITLRLPPTRIINCSELRFFDDPMDYEKFNYSWRLENFDEPYQSLASGNGVANAIFFLKSGPPFTEFDIDGSDLHSQLQVQVQDFFTLRLSLNVTSYQPHQPGKEIMFSISGSDCPCNETNFGDVGLHSFNNSDQVEDFRNQPNFSDYVEFTGYSCNSSQSNDPAHFGNQGEAVLLLCNVYQNPEVCVPHTPCKDNEEYLVHPGNLERDNICAAQKYCNANQFIENDATSTSARECSDIIKCTNLEYQNISATATSQAECTILAPCEKTNQYRNQENNCFDITECDETQIKKTLETPFSDAKCITYEVECSETEIISVPQSATTEKVCAAATICAPTEFELSSGDENTQRECKPMLECSLGEVEQDPGDFKTDVLCKPVVEFSYVWFMGISFCVIFMACFFWMSYFKYKIGGYTSV